MEGVDGIAGWRGEAAQMSEQSRVTTFARVRGCQGGVDAAPANGSSSTTTTAAVVNAQIQVQALWRVSGRRRRPRRCVRACVPSAAQCGAYVLEAGSLKCRGAHHRRRQGKPTSPQRADHLAPPVRD